jgi:hypothetical protein
MCGPGSEWERCGREMGGGRGKGDWELAPASKTLDARARAYAPLSVITIPTPSVRQTFDMAVLQARLLALLILAVAAYAGEFVAT